jgi:DNA mismatch repair protein MutS2
VTTPQTEAVAPAATDAEAPARGEDPARRGLAKAQADLSWRRVVRAIAGRCRGPLGERLEELPLASTRAEAQVALRETREAMRLAELGDGLPLEGIREVGDSLDRLSRRGALDGLALRHVAATLGAARVLRRYLARHRDEAPTLFTACSTDPTLDDLQDELTRTLDPDGTLADHASPELAALRREVGNLRARIIAKLEQLMLKHADILQDQFHTLREDRYVLPVRTDAHEKLPGIVHSTSGSGATVFVEPQSVIGQGNRLKMAQGELEREEARLLGILSDRVMEQLPAVRGAVEALDRADLRSAGARLGKDLGGVVVDLADGPVLDLRGARHPLLVLEMGREAVVPSDIAIEGGKALVISGPNAGGKTVALKLLGLSALMVRAGLPIAADEGSKAGFFAPVLTDVGDAQSLEKNLSTFSAQVSNVVRIIEAATEGTLVLLDEIATGTDPSEGAALACAILDALCRAGAGVAVTTHYEALKALATDDPRLRNAAVGFDVDTMQPTFRLRFDVPGVSSALAVAERYGMPMDVLDRARAILPEQSLVYEKLIGSLEDAFRGVDAERTRAVEMRQEAERLTREAEEKRAELAARDRKRLTQEAEKLMAELRAARAELKAAKKALRKKERHDQEALAAVRQQLDKAAGMLEGPREQLAQAPAPEEERGEVVEERDLAVGDRVWLPRMRAEVDVLEGPTKGRIRVAAGPVKLWVSTKDVRKLGEDGPAQESPAPAPAPRRTEPEGDRPRTDRNSLDLRGLRVDDALTMTETFLDRLYGADEPMGYIVHGIGSGALRDAVRTHLVETKQYVRRIRPGSLEEGGERLTVVYLR